jgi:nucleotide-binding universal stress UspA family protein
VEPIARILVPVDGSALAEAVLPVAEALARDYEAELALLRAVQMPSVETLDPAGEADLTSAKAYVAGIANQLRMRGLQRVRWTLPPGPPAQAIAEATSREAADLVVMATHGRGALGRLLLGSVAEAVVRETPAPVLLVRGLPAWAGRGIGAILVPLDGSPAAEAVLPAVERLAGPFDYSIHLLHVVEPLPAYAAVEIPAHLEETTEARRGAAAHVLATAVARLEAKGLRVQSAVRTGPVVEEIQKYVTANGIGLVAMTTHGRTGLARVLMGSVSERVVREAPVPVLLWRARREQDRSERVAA